MLLGLPISGDAVGPRVIPSTWLDDLEERFANIDITIDVEEHPKATGPAKLWNLHLLLGAAIGFVPGCRIKNTD